MMVIKAAERSAQSPAMPLVQLISASQSAPTQSLSKKLQTRLEKNGLSASTVTWSSSTTSGDVSKTNSVCIVLDNGNQPMLPDPSSGEFEALKSLLSSGGAVLWVSFRESDSDYAAAMQALVVGMARVVRREMDCIFVTLNVKEALGNDFDALINAITTVATSKFWPKHEGDRSNEIEFALANGRVEVPRIHINSELNRWEDRKRKKAKIETCVYGDRRLPLKLEVETPGLLNSLRFVHDERSSSLLGPDEIEIKALAYGVNFRDVFIALGQMPTHLSMAGEVCGIVTAVGSGEDTNNKYKIGDRVAGVGLNPFSSYPRLKSLHAYIVPDSISSIAAASIPAVYITAYHCFVDIARLQKGQTVLIHSASGGVGQASIQIAKHIGAEIFATVGSAAKRDFIVDKYNISPDHIFSSKTSTTGFKEGIMRLTSNKGVDVVLNSLAGEMLSESWDCLAEFGTHVEIGKADIYKRGHLDMKTFDKATTFAAVDLFRLSQGKPQLIWDTLGKVFDLIDRGIVAPVQPLQVYTMDQIEPAFRLISERKHIGKVILEIKDDTEVKAVLPPPTPLRLDAHGTYVIAGGLGDLGRRLAVLLASYGAGHIVTLSRRTINGPTRAKLEDDVRHFGGQLHIEKCDITNRGNVEEVFQRCSTTMPRVRGLIHGGMVLKVSLCPATAKSF
jgi:NADPH:quinone reductase-like Zn-dependent oxidoreductase